MFDRIVEDALASLAPPFAERVRAIRVVREPVPFRELVDPRDPSSTPPDILGLFVGPTIHDLAEDFPAQLPPSIYLFQRNLERMARDEEHLAEEIRVTLFHEIGHLLGLDEDGVAALGLA
jgi:predicted Zn-dependent protease with MMP-like domain